MTGPPLTFTCIECGGTAHLLSHLPADEPLEEGFPLAYRCAECMDRFDVVWEEGDEDPTARGR